ncbi:MAG: LCP family protein [Patescibacteria group bacterium]
MPFQKKMVNGFRRKTLSYKAPREKNRIFTPQVNAFITAFLILGIFVFGIFKAVKGISFRSIISVLATDLKEDRYGHTNILLLGTGSVGHDAADLTDTMIIASIDEAKNKVTFVSIPRDLYIKDKKYGGMRINNVYFAVKKEYADSTYALDVLQQHMENVIGMDIQYRIKIDFSVFKEVVDAIGGIDIFVPEMINDPLYPKGETGFYETFFIPQGLQHMDGETALKYARSRHSTSDFSRSARQQSIISAIKEKAKKAGITNNTDMMEDLYNVIEPKIETNIGIREMITLAEIGSKMDQGGMGNYLIHDDPSRCGGFLYPPEKELYGGASVLVPAKNSFEDIQKMIDIVMNNSQTKNVKVQVLNGTKKPMLAGKTKDIFQRHCIDVVRYGNGKDSKQIFTTYYRKTNTPEINTMISVLQQFIPGMITDEVPAEYLTPTYASDADIILNLGSDYLQYELKDPFDQIFAIKKPEKTEEAGTTTNTTETTTPTSILNPQS